MKILLTGAAGFAGAHAVRHLLMNTDYEIVAPVSFTHRGLARRIESSICDQPGADRLEIVHWDMRSPADSYQLSRFEQADAIWNIASESHVDRSISDPLGFTTNNTLLILNILEVARKIEPMVFLQMSTDEVYGPAYGTYRHREWDTIAPSNPYSASKAGQEAVCFSQWRTFGIPLILSNTMNLIGEMQDPEKFLPMIIRNVRDGNTTYVHSSPEGVPGSRFYLHARNLADAWLYLTRAVEQGLIGLPSYNETLLYSDGGERPMRFHIVGEQEIDNRTLVETVAGFMGKTANIGHSDFHASRPGHDLRYALDGSKLDGFGWKPPVPLLPSLEKTVTWYLSHQDWLDDGR